MVDLSTPLHHPLIFPVNSAYVIAYKVQYNSYKLVARFALKSFESAINKGLISAHKGAEKKKKK